MSAGISTYALSKEHSAETDVGIVWLSFSPGTKCCKKIKTGYNGLG